MSPRDRDSIHDLSELDPHRLLILIADRQLELGSDIGDIKTTLSGPDGRGGLVGEVTEHRVRIDRIEKTLSNPPPKNNSLTPSAKARATISVERWKAIAAIVGAIVGAGGLVGAAYVAGCSSTAATPPAQAAPLHQR